MLMAKNCLISFKMVMLVLSNFLIGSRMANITILGVQDLTEISISKKKADGPFRSF